MALVVGQNSWVTIVEADTYLENKIGASDWFDKSDIGDPGAESKETLLVSAFFWLSNYPDYDLSPSLTDDDVKKAQIEAAFFLMQNYENMNQHLGAIFSGLTEIDYSKRKEKFDMKNLVLPVFIKGLLAIYGGGHEFVILKGEYDAD